MSLVWFVPVLLSWTIDGKTMYVYPSHAKHSVSWIEATDRKFISRLRMLLRELRQKVKNIIKSKGLRRSHSK